MPHDDLPFHDLFIIHHFEFEKKKTKEEQTSTEILAAGDLFYKRRQKEGNCMGKIYIKVIRAI